MKLTPGQRIWIDKVLAALNAAEAGPTKADLSEAPVLDCWRPFFSRQGTPILWGIVSGHLSLRNTDHITTSQLVALDGQNIGPVLSHDGIVWLSHSPSLRPNGLRAST